MPPHQLRHSTDEASVEHLSPLMNLDLEVGSLTDRIIDDLRVNIVA